MEKIKYKCFAKGKNNNISCSTNTSNWIISKRGFLKILDNEIIFKSWRFKIENINKPVIYTINTFLFSAKILSFEYEGKEYQFGLNPWVHIEKHLPLTPEYINEQISNKIMIIRVFLLGYLTYYLIQKLFR